MKHIRRHLFIVLSIILTSFSFAAPFSHTTNLINIPTAGKLVAGDYEFGMSSAIYGSSKYEFDYKFNYSFTSDIAAGMTLINDTDIVGNLHANFLNMGSMRVGGGFLYLSNKSDLSTIEGYSLSKSIQTSNYIVASIQESKALTIHAGLGKKYFSTNYESDDFLSVLRGFGGIFFGAELDFLHGKAMLEFDGIGLNLGYKLEIDKNQTLQFAFTELTNGETYPDSDFPTRYFGISFSIKNNLFSEYDKKLESFQGNIDKLTESRKTLDALISNSQKELDKLAGIKKELMLDLTQFDEKFSKNDPLYKKYRSKKSKTLALFMTYFDEARNEFGNKNHLSAISLLDKADLMISNNDKVLFWLGKNYMEIGEKESAFKYWKKAYSVNNYLAEIWALPYEYLEKITDKDGPFNKLQTVKQKESYSTLNELLLEIYGKYSELKRRGRMKEAFVYLEQGISIDPSNLLFLKELAYFYEDIGSREKFKEVVETGLSVSPYDSDFLKMESKLND
ncbi:tetratricopeptide repeat protein [bacterium]|jgi:tetratricopeptide (TPR) repeat protein|nr:tetratricopeptide repeat protein [bacterium]